MLLEQIKEMLRDRVTRKVAAASGVHPATIRNIKNGTNTNPSYKVLAKLAEYLGIDTNG